jgi:hypothetical protein
MRTNSHDADERALAWHAYFWEHSPRSSDRPGTRPGRGCRGRAGTLDDQTEAKVGRHLAQAERLHGKGETASAIDQLNTAIRLLDDSDLRDALEALVDTLQ